MLKNIILQNFRNYSKRSFEFSSNSTLIVGPNAVGKTNVLEAIYCLSTGKSFRADTEKELLQETEQVSRIAGQLENDELEIIWDNRERFQKLYRVNGVGKRQVDFAGHLLVVLFAPTDLDIVIGSPSLRRHYLDHVLSQVHKDYRLAQKIYEKAIRQRNRLLYRMKNGELSPPAGGENVNDQLSYWNELLIDKGEIIHNFRKGYLDYFNSSQNTILPLELQYDHSIISEMRLVKYKNEELAAGTTLVGPQRDDVKISYKPSLAADSTERKAESGKRIGRELSTFGSRGEQRLGVFVLKLAELDYIEAQTGQRPILLLDDIFSELDTENRKHILGVIPRQQTILTTTDIHSSEETILKKLASETVRLSG